MDESILTSIKKMLGIAKEYTAFDMEIIMHINAVFSILSQLGVGPDEGFSIEGDDAVWSDYLSSAVNLNTVMTYIYLKVRLIFDPPTSSAVIESMNRMISELEWRINVTVDPSDDGGEEAT